MFSGLIADLMRQGEIFRHIRSALGQGNDVLNTGSKKLGSFNKWKPADPAGFYISLHASALSGAPLSGCVFLTHK